MLISEIMEKVLELKLLRKEEDCISEDGKFMHSETILNEYTPTNRIKMQKIHSQIKTMSEKILQETDTILNFKTNKYGDIIEQQCSVDYGLGPVKNEPVKYQNVYNKNNLLYSKVHCVHHNDNSDPIECVSRTAYQYDEHGKIKVIICDCIPTNGEKIPSTNFVQTYIIEYDEDGMVSSINLIDIDTCNNDYKYHRFIINYSNGGYISTIHLEGADTKEDEYYQYYNDSTVKVVKNKYDKSGTVISKTVLDFKVA